MVAKTKKPHTIAENLVIPAAFRIAEIMLGKTEVDKIKTIPHSNDTMTRRIDDMAEDIIKQISEKVIQKQQFTLQIDESKDVSTYSQLMMFVRYIDDEDEQGIQEQIYGCKELDTKRTGEDIFKILNEHIVKNGLSWEWCVSVCTDGSAATLSEFCEENEIPLNESVKENIKEHLVNLEPNFEHYFPNVEEHEDPQKL
ncbi:hypothetical protein Y1Q_0017601 [Alligator mississippiensis]|uniref:Uncharacterized protein n=1 Tax=Alligator mississippiensis TaxID=8496 RepID=A0A151P2X5_ALLMI|nr:hypothetical protein Y1Q_0017601 [Alligator mississippiensis]